MCLLEKRISMLVDSKTKNYFVHRDGEIFGDGNSDIEICRQERAVANAWRR